MAAILRVVVVLTCSFIINKNTELSEAYYHYKLVRKAIKNNGSE